MNALNQKISPVDKASGNPLGITHLLSADR
jgi:hypothetical protein